MSEPEAPPRQHHAPADCLACCVMLLCCVVLCGLLCVALHGRSGIGTARGERQGAPASCGRTAPAAAESPQTTCSSPAPRPPPTAAPFAPRAPAAASERGARRRRGPYARRLRWSGRERGGAGETRRRAAG
eukprot:171719-Rhodomonas_salina.1